MPVTIEGDSHKASHTAAVLDEHGQLLDQQRFPATRAGQQSLLEWAGCWPQRCWAVEGARRRPGTRAAAGRGREVGPPTWTWYAASAHSKATILQGAVGLTFLQLP
jgi:hypothetical protein